jgi:hypothetical protein
VHVYKTTTPQCTGGEVDGCRVRLSQWSASDEEDVRRCSCADLFLSISTEAEGLDVVLEAKDDLTRSDFCAFKALQKPRGTFYQHDCLLVESKTAKES